MRRGLTSLTSFTTAPLRISAVFAGLMFVTCFAGVLWILYGYFTRGYGVTGWTTLVVLLFGFHDPHFALIAIPG